LGDLPLSSLFGQLKNNFEEILGVKQKLNTLQDGGRRKPQKEHFWPVNFFEYCGNENILFIK
jgi:hypothetical protein